MDEKKIFAIIENRNDDLIYKKAQIELFFDTHPDEDDRAKYIRSAYERMQLADSIAYTSRDITKEAREAGFLPLAMLAHSVKGGYPEVQKQIYGLLCESDTPF